MYTNTRFCEHAYLLPFIANAFVMNHLGSDMRLNQVGLSHVANAEEKEELSVPQGDDCVLGEHDGVGAVFRPSQFGEDNARHAGGYHNAQHALDAHQDNGLGAFFRCLT